VGPELKSGAELDRGHSRALSPGLDWFSSSPFSSEKSPPAFGICSPSCFLAAEMGAFIRFPQTDWLYCEKLRQPSTSMVYFLSSCPFWLTGKSCIYLVSPWKLFPHSMCPFRHLSAISFLTPNLYFSFLRFITYIYSCPCWQMDCLPCPPPHLDILPSCDESWQSPKSPTCSVSSLCPAQLIFLIKKCHFLKGLLTGRWCPVFYFTTSAISGKPSGSQPARDKNHVVLLLSNPGHCFETEMSPKKNGLCGVFFKGLGKAAVSSPSLSELRSVLFYLGSSNPAAENKRNEWHARGCD
jgi:hypothetical protein